MRDILKVDSGCCGDTMLCYAIHAIEYILRIWLLLKYKVALSLSLSECDMLYDRDSLVLAVRWMEKEGGGCVHVRLLSIPK